MSVAAAELRAWPVPVSEPWPATPSPVRPRHGGVAQDVLPLPASGRFPRSGGPGHLLVSARSRVREPHHLELVGPPLEADDDGPRATPAGDLPEASAVARTIAAATLEVLTGARPASQLLRWMAPDVYAQVSARSAAASARRRPGSPVPRTAVRGMTCCAPSDNVVEVATVVVVGPRVKALALRLEGWDGRWRVTALELR